MAITLKNRECLLLISTALFSTHLLLCPVSARPQQNQIAREESINFPPLILLGVILSENSSLSLAVLRNEETGKVETFGIGDEVYGLTLVRVFENRIILQKGEKTFQIFIGRKTAKLVSSSEEWSQSSEKEVQAQKESMTNTQEEKGFMRKEFLRAEIEKRIVEDWESFARELEVVPYEVKGKIEGFEITSVPALDLASQAGIFEGDIIKEINGIKLDSWKTLLSLFSTLKDENKFKVIIERKGKTIRMEYILK